LPPKVKFREIILEGSTFQHRLFMKKDKLTQGIILLNVIDYLFYHVARAKIAKDAWDNFCATFERRHVGNKL
jgi:hypothetical protein